MELKKLVGTALVATLFAGIKFAYGGTERTYLVSGEAEGGGCLEVTESALSISKARAAEKCANYTILSTRYIPNSPSESCAVTAAGLNSRSVTLKVKCGEM